MSAKRTVLGSVGARDRGQQVTSGSETNGWQCGRKTNVEAMGSKATRAGWMYEGTRQEIHKECSAWRAWGVGSEGPATSVSEGGEGRGARTCEMLDCHETRCTFRQESWALVDPLHLLLRELKQVVHSFDAEGCRHIQQPCLPQTVLYLLGGRVPREPIQCRQLKGACNTNGRDARGESQGGCTREQTFELEGEGSKAARAGWMYEGSSGDDNGWGKV